MTAPEPAEPSWSGRWPVSVKGVVTAAGHVLLLRNERDEWELPGGRLEPGETPERGVQREIREETGLSVEVDGIVDSWVLPIRPDHQVLIVTYRCVDLGPTAPPLTVSDEHRAARWTPIADCQELPLPEGYLRSIRASTGAMPHAGPDPRPLLRRQLDLAWGLARHTLDGLTDDEALWCPSPQSWTVRRRDDGSWHADWAEPEPWPAPSTSIAWIQWHVIWWWSTVIDRSFGPGTRQRQEVTWPGAEEAMVAIGDLRGRWLDLLDGLEVADLAGGALTRWPYADGRPFAELAGWVNAELMKNVAEMAQLRRLGRPDVGGPADPTDPAR